MATAPLTTLYIDFRAGLASLDSDMQKISRTLSRSSRDFEKIGASLTKSLTLPIIAGAAVVVKAADSYQKAQRTIQTQTGQTGQSLQKLKKDFDAIASSVPNSFGETAHALAQVNARTGETGKAAQQLAKQFLELSNVTETDLNANLQEGLTLFDTWGVAVKEQPKILDEFYRASQLAGKSVTELISSVGNADAVLDPFGFSLEESIALMTSFARGGVDAEKMMGALTKAFAFFSNAGIKDAKGALTELLRQIKATPDSTDTANKAFDVFGKKVGLEIIDAIKEGRFNYGQYLDVIKNGSETIEGAAAKNKTFTDQIRQSFNSINIAIANGVNPKVFEQLNEQIALLGEKIVGVVNWFTKLPKPIQQATVEFLALAAATGPIFTYLAWTLSSGATVVKWLGLMARATKDWAVAQVLLNQAIVAGFVTKMAALGAILLPLAPILVTIAAGIALFAVAVKAAGGDITDTFSGLGSLIKDGFVTLWTEGIKFVQQEWNDFTSFFTDNSKKIEALFVAFIEILGLPAPVAQEMVNQMKDAFIFLKDIVVETFNILKISVVSTLNSISKTAAEFVGNFKRGLLVIKYGGVAAAAASPEFAALEEALRSIGKQTEIIAKDGGVGGAFSDISSIVGDGIKAIGNAGKEVDRLSKHHIPGLNDALSQTKEQAKAAQAAIDNIAKSLIDSKAAAEVDKLKQSVEDLISGVGDVQGLGSKADISGQLAAIGQKLRDKNYADEKENLDKIEKEKGAVGLANAKKVIDEKTAYELQIYSQNLAPKMLEVDKKNHTEAVNFYQGLMEDLVSGTRFDWENQLKKAGVAVAAEWLANMVEANVLASKSFAEMFDGVIAALTKGLDSWFSKSGLGNVVGSGGTTAPGTGGGIFQSLSNIFGGSSSEGGGVGQYGSAIGPTIDGGNLGGGVGQYGTAIGPTADGGNLASGGASSFSALDGAAIAYTIQNDLQALQKFGKDAKGTGTAIGAGAGTALGAYFGGPIGAAIGSKIGSELGAFVGKAFGTNLTPNETALKKFEGTMEDTLAKALGKSVNFVIGDIEKFAKPGWADEFWQKFGDKGASQFQGLGEVFKTLFGIEGPVGSQIGALLAENLAGTNFTDSLDNIKLLMDSIGISAEDMSKALLETARAGNVSWHEFQTFSDSLAQIPTEGLAAFGDLKGAMDEVLQSNGRGIQAIKGLKDIAVEAGEAGVTSFDGLKQYLLNAGYAAETVTALMQGLATRGIKNLNELKNASDPALGGVISDMETLGVKWEEFATDSKLLTDGIGDLADQIKNLSNAIKDIPKSIDISTNFTSSGDRPDPIQNKNGAVLKFAMGGVVNSPTLFPVANGGIGLMGEAGAEGILPLGRVKGKLGVNASGLSSAPNFNIYIDATGADAGVEHRVMQAVQSMRPGIIADAVAVANYQSGRSVS